MKCRECGQEVLLADRCPYCGRPVRASSQAGAGGPSGDLPGAGPTGSGGTAGSAKAGSRAGEQTESRQGITGRFVGPIGRYDASRNGWAGAGSSREGMGSGFSWVVRGGRRTQTAPVSLGQWLRRLFTYLLDPRVAGWKKGLILGGLLYILSPLDFLPDLPPLGWLDDVALVWFGWQALARELLRYGLQRPASGRPGSGPHEERRS